MSTGHWYKKIELDHSFMKKTFCNHCGSAAFQAVVIGYIEGEATKIRVNQCYDNPEHVSQTINQRKNSEYFFYQKRYRELILENDQLRKALNEALNDSSRSNKKENKTKKDYSSPIGRTIGHVSPAID